MHITTIGIDLTQLLQKPSCLQRSCCLMMGRQHDRCYVEEPVRQALAKLGTEAGLFMKAAIWVVTATANKKYISRHLPPTQLCISGLCLPHYDLSRLV